MVCGVFLASGDVCSCCYFFSVKCWLLFVFAFYDGGCCHDNMFFLAWCVSCCGWVVFRQ